MQQLIVGSGGFVFSAPPPPKGPETGAPERGVRANWPLAQEAPPGEPQEAAKRGFVQSRLLALKPPPRSQCVCASLCFCLFDCLLACVSFASLCLFCLPSFFCFLYVSIMICCFSSLFIAFPCFPCNCQSLLSTVFRYFSLFVFSFHSI